MDGEERAGKALGSYCNSPSERPGGVGDSMVVGVEQGHGINSHPGGGQQGQQPSEVAEGEEIHRSARNQLGVFHMPDGQHFCTPREAALR